MSNYKLWTSLYEALFPRYCLSCKKEGSWLCKDCQEAIDYLKEQFCPFCQRITETGRPCSICRPRHNLTGLLAAAHFKFPINRLIHKLKYQGTKELSQLLIQITIKGTRNRLPKGKKLIIPIPLHPKQERKRGFNQAELMAKELSKKTKIEYDPKILKRIKNTKSQTKLNRRERRENLKNAFAITKNIDLKEYIVLLVDDVTTTGATLDEAAKTLKQAQPKEIWGLVVARR